MKELKREGLSIQAISQVTGFDRKTIRKYLLKPGGRPVYGSRPAQVSKLKAFKPYLEGRLQAGACGTGECCLANYASVITVAATRF